MRAASSVAMPRTTNSSTKVNALRTAMSLDLVLSVPGIRMDFCSLLPDPGLMKKQLWRTTGVFAISVHTFERILAPFSSVVRGEGLGMRGRACWKRNNILGRGHVLPLTPRPPLPENGVRGRTVSSIASKLGLPSFSSGKPRPPVRIRSFSTYLVQSN